MATAARSASPIRVNPLPISEAFLRAAQELGIPFNDDFNGASQDGVGHYQLTHAQRRALLGGERLSQAGARRDRT